MNAIPQHVLAARDLAYQLVTDEARIASAMARIYRATGSFQAVVSAMTTELRALAAQVQEEGGDLQGWVG